MTTVTTPFPLGAYLGDPNGSSASAEATFEANYSQFTSMTGIAPTCLDNYVDYTQPISAWVSNAGWQAWSDAQSADAKGATPVIALPLASINLSAGTADARYKAIASGIDDSVFQASSNHT